MFNVYDPSSIEFKTLTKLAQRKNPLWENWRDYRLVVIGIGPEAEWRWICGICDHKMEAGIESAEHGMQHLKESNLLPFI